MSLSRQSAMLTTNAKASGRKLTLTVIKNLDKERKTWMVEVIRKSGLLGQHDTIRVKWLPQNQDYQVAITGMAHPAKAQLTLKQEDASSSSSLAGDGMPTDTSMAGDSVDVKMEKQEKKVHTKGSTQYLLTPGKAVVKTDHVVMEEGEEAEGDEEDQETAILAERLQRMEILNRMRELEHAQLLRDVELENARRGVVVTSGRVHTGLYGLREDSLVENLINTECDKHKVWTHPVSGREETPAEREVRMMLYDMIVTSLQNFMSMYSGEHVGDNYAILRNVMSYGAPSSMRMRIDLTMKLGNYHKKTHQGYQDFELGLQHLSNDLCTVGMTLSQDELTLRLIAGMTVDKRYEKECREVSERAESYSTCNSVFVQRAQALGNLTSTHRAKDEANALEESKSKGRGGKGKGRGRGKGGKGAGRGSSSGNSSKPPCYNFLAGKECSYGDECRFEHVTQKQLDAREKKKKDKKKTTTKKPAKGGSDSSGDDKSKSPKKGETAEQKSKRRKKQPCYQFQQTGSCANGKKCEYNHVAAELSNDSAEDSNHVDCMEEGGLWGRRDIAEKPRNVKQGVACGPPQPELILSAHLTI